MVAIRRATKDSKKPTLLSKNAVKQEIVSIYCKIAIIFVCKLLKYQVNTISQQHDMTYCKH